MCTRPYFNLGEIPKKSKDNGKDIRYDNTAEGAYVTEGFV